MELAGLRSRVAEGHEALASGEWERARDAFAEVVAQSDAPEALDGLGRALWWLRDARGAVVHRERAYAAFRRDGDLGRAARIALWLAREHAAAFGNDAVAGGWLARARRLLGDVAPGGDAGWLALAESERARDADRARSLAAQALDAAVAMRDVDLELRALAQLGLAEVTLGRVEEGLARLDEAMAAATAGEPAALETFADVCCTLMLACQVAGDRERAGEWSRVLEGFARRYEPVVLLAFCRTCCADVMSANGRVDAAEAELVAAVRELTATGQRSRCVHPAARLAEVRVHQGRLDEAAQLLAGIENEPDAVATAAALRLARGDAGQAVTALERRLAQLGPENLLAAPLLSLLVEARLALADAAGAAEAAGRLERLAAAAGRARQRAAAALARGRVAAATGDPSARALLEEAAGLFASDEVPLEAARASLALARALAPSSPHDAVAQARRARDALEALGALREADAAAALMRSLGVKGRTSPRGAGALTRREREVLALLAEGLSNRDLAARLFISPKTAEHHVARVLAKLGLRSRAEAAAYAARTMHAAR